MNELLIGLIGLAGGVTGAIIAGLSGLFSIQFTDKVNEKKIYSARIIKDYLDNGLSLLLNSCQDCIRIVDTNHFKGYTNKNIPFGDALKLDFRYGTQFYEYFQVISCNLRMGKSGERLPQNTKPLLIALQKELYWFYNRQSIHLRAKDFHLLAWKLWAHIRFKRERDALKQALSDLNSDSCNRYVA